MMFEALNDGMLMMEVAGLNMYGKTVTLPMVKSWLDSLERRGIDSESLVTRACNWFIDRHDDYPTCAQFGHCCEELRTKTHVAIGVLMEDGETIRVELREPGQTGYSEPKRVRSAGDIMRKMVESPKALPEPISDDETKRRAAAAIRELLDSE